MVLINRESPPETTIRIGINRNTGGIVEREAAINVSNVMIVCPKCGKPTRVGHKFNEGDGKLSRRKVRVCKKCSAVLDN